jgi:hypothetical protein
MISPGVSISGTPETREGIWPVSDFVGSHIVVSRAKLEPDADAVILLKGTPNLAGTMTLIDLLLGWVEDDAGEDLATRYRDAIAEVTWRYEDERGGM